MLDLNEFLNILLLEVCSSNRTFKVHRDFRFVEIWFWYDKMEYHRGIVAAAHLGHLAVAMPSAEEQRAADAQVVGDSDDGDDDYDIDGDTWADADGVAHAAAQQLVVTHMSQNALDELRDRNAHLGLSTDQRRGLAQSVVDSIRRAREGIDWRAKEKLRKTRQQV